MSCTSLEQKQCATCNKVGGIMMCDGCKKTFCGKHVVEHRQQLALELEHLMLEHDCIQQDIVLQKENHPSFQQIDQWEKESMAKIQQVAEKTRDDLRQMLHYSHERLAKICRDIAMNLRSAQEAENYSEVDLTRWTQQLSELKSQIESPILIDIPKKNDSSIHFIRIHQENTADAVAKPTKWSTIVQDRFAQAQGSAIIDEDGHRFKHNNKDLTYVLCRGHGAYSHGRNTVRFQVEKCAGGCNLFVGISPSDVSLPMLMHRLTAVAGWLSNHTLWQDQTPGKKTGLNDYGTDDIKTDDVFELTLDCDKKQIELFHERTHREEIIQIDTNKSSFPWSILVILCRKDDCVRILSNN